MAIVYKHTNGTYQRRNEHEVDGLDVHDAVDAIIGNRGDWAHNEEYRTTPANLSGAMGYGPGAVLIERENEDGEYEPYMIIGGE